MKPTAVFATFALAAALLAAFPGARAGEVITSRADARHLPLPAGDGVFHFIVFSDRTGGVPAGIEILRQAVADTNLLDPDLVMTVGDLVQGVCPPAQWIEEMKEYRGVMEQLAMPWFPVAGNHDVYWPRSDSKPPPGEFEGHFEKHFGPLWYAFAHKNAGFVVLFTDEGNPALGPKHYSKPEQTQMSARQMTWLKETLAKLAGLDHVFVFLHHPRWIEKRYPENNWREVHRILAEAGNVRTVFAGHIHYLHHAGRRDGIEYLSLGSTGSSIPGWIEAVELGFLHHLTVVTVREKNVSISILPVGSVLDPKQFDARRQEDLHLLVDLFKNTPMPPLAVDAGGHGGGTAETTWSNPASRAIEITLRPAFDSDAWFFSPDHRHLTLQPGQSATVAFDWVHLPGRDTPEPPQLALHVDYLGEDFRLTLPERAAPFKVARPPAKK